MNGVRTRKQTAKGGKPKDEKAAGDANGKANVYINTNGLVAKRAESSENIFLFYPNIIGVFQVLSSPLLSCLVSDPLQATHASSLPLHLSITCPSIHERAPSFTAYHACWMPLTALLLDTFSSRLASVPC